MDQPLHPELARRWANLPDLKYRGSNEWSSACPSCGGGGLRRDPSDRFRLFGPEPGKNARAWCRQCSFFAWADDDQKRPSPELVEAAQRERIQLLEAENQRIKEKIRAIADANFWRRWHDDMLAPQRQLWHQQGIIDYFIDYYSLGYTTNHTYYHDGQEWVSPALTLPHYEAGWQLSNIQYRLLEPANGAGKYRQTAGLPAAMFLTEPDEPLTGAVVVVEGAKKAIVTYTHLGQNFDGAPVLVVAVPSKTPAADMLKRLNNCDPVYLMLDPDAYIPTRASDGRTLPPVAGRVASKIGRERVRVVKLPVKPDDLFTMYGGNAGDLTAYLRQGVRA